MLSKYFKFKIKTKHFEADSKKVMEECVGKKVVVFANSDEFIHLNKIYKYTEKLDIAGFVITNGKHLTQNKLCSYPIIEKNDLKNVKYDEILVIDSNAEEIINEIKYHLVPDMEQIKTPFVEYVKEETKNLNYLLKYKFDKKLPKLIKKLKNKTVMFYGAGIFFQVIKEYFDLSPLNVIGIVDKKYNNAGTERYLYDYRLYSTEDIINLKPDYVIITTKVYVPIWEGLYFDFLDKTKTKIIPIVKKNILSLLHDIIDS